MNCQETDKRVDQALFGKDRTIRKKVLEHISQCDRCGKLYKHLAASAALMDSVRQSTPQLDEPEAMALTDRILGSLKDTDSPADNTRTRRVEVVNLLTRILAAASVLFFMTFVVEQYLVVEKVRHLENSLEISGNFPKTGIQNISLFPLREPLIGNGDPLGHLINDARDHAFRVFLIRNRILNQSTPYFAMAEEHLSELSTSDEINKIIPLR